MKNRNKKQWVPMLLALPAFFFASCNLDMFPTGALTPEQLAADPGGAVYATAGNYSGFKDEMEYSGYASGNSYVRHYFQMAEYPGDNTSLRSHTTDVLYEAMSYKNYTSQKNVQALWFFAYRIISGANAVIDPIVDGESILGDQLKGENLFMRALCHLHLVTLYAKPYSHGRENPGIVLRISINTSETKRATVGEVYDQIVLDLQNAARLMTPASKRGNAGYASHDAALGLLSRVYLYMGEYQKAIDTVNEMLAGADPGSKLEPTATYPTYFAKALDSKETLFAVAHTAMESRGTSSIASMYFTDPPAPKGGGEGGWGEIYSSDPLNNLYERYPNDVRYTAYVKPYYLEGVDRWQITFPIPGLADTDFRLHTSAIITQTDGKWDPFKITDGEGKEHTLTVQEELINGEYPSLYVMFNGEKITARINKQIVLNMTAPQYFVTKFSYQDGIALLSSPVMLRWAEVILNRAEAYAQLGQDAQALADVNVIRTRAGLSGDALFDAGKMHGYDKVLDVVLDERRMELAFEGHRVIDVYRNKRDMDRRFAGAHPWEVVSWNDNKIQYPIPFNEIAASGIPQNPGY